MDFLYEDMNISQMLAANAANYPEEVALVEIAPRKRLRKEVNWREFDNRVNCFANFLLQRGVTKGDRVLHMMRNSIDWLVTYFGIIRTGAWAVPLNFRFTSSDIKYCADIAEARLMILEGEFLERVEAIHSELVKIEEYIFVGDGCPDSMTSFEKALSSVNKDSVEIELRGEDGCGLYFTSGTTGTPKSILLTHRNMEFAAIVEQKHHYQSHADNFILIPPLYHTGAKMHWFGSLLVGGRSTLLNEITPEAIFEAIDREKGTIVWLLVPWVQDILSALDRKELNKDAYDLNSLRLMHIGAQPVPPILVQWWKKYFPRVQYDTNYGLGEASGPGCVHLGMENEHKVGAIGQAGYGWQTRVVNEKGEDVPKGNVGELLVKGAGVMKEYYKNPQMTNETIKNGWLYTGDMVREDEDGFIYIVDRKKDVIIRGGENIYPVEIEEVLQRHPKVHDVAVIGLSDERLGEIVAAVIMVKQGTMLTEGDVITFCERNLPRFKLPKRIIFDTVPRNPTGKIEKPKLRQKYSGMGNSL
jgi:acyl-CoA synthetase (AMP-forming)/AMP-acid ligase II